MNANTVDFIVNAPPAALLAAKLTFLLFSAWAIHFGLARLSPRWRVLLWRAATVGILALPLLAVLSPALRVGLPVRPEPVIEAPLNFEVPPLLPPPVLQPRFETLPDADLPPVPPPAPPVRWDYRLAVIWITGAILLALRFIYAQRAMGRLSRRGAPAPEAIQQIFSRIAAQTGLPRVRLAVSDQVRSPLLHGLRRPVVLLPGGMTRPEYAPDLPAIFAHELSHAAARDLAWLGLVRLVQFMLWPHPLVWRMHAACAAATERACDAAAAGIIDDREVYSRSLARIALALAGRPVGQAALAMAIPDIRRRLLALKNAPSITPPRRGAVRLAALTGLIGLAALSTMQPVKAELPAEKIIEVPLAHVKAAEVVDSVRNILDIGSPSKIGEGVKVEATQDKNAVRVVAQNEQLAKDVTELIINIDKPDENAPLLATRITLKTGGKLPLDDFMRKLTAAASAAFKSELDYKINFGARAVIACDFKDMPLRELLDTVLLPIGLVWDVNNAKTIMIWPRDIHRRPFNVTDEELGEVRRQLATGELAAKIWGPAGPPNPECRIFIDEKMKTLVVEGKDVHFERTKDALATLQPVQAPSPIVEDLKTRQNVVFLKYERNTEVARQINSIIAPQGDPREWVFIIRPGESKQNRLMKIDGVQLELGAGDRAKDRASFQISDDKESTKLSLRRGECALWHGRIILAEDLGGEPIQYMKGPDGRQIPRAAGTGRLRLRIKWTEKGQGIQTHGPIPLIDGITVAPFENDKVKNVVLIRSSDREAEKFVMGQIARLDQPGTPGTAPDTAADSDKSEMLVRIYKIKEQDRPRIQLLINPIITANPGAPFDRERKLILDKDDLIVRDTPGNIKKIEELLLEKKLIQDDRGKLDTASFSLVPRDTKTVTDQARAFGSRVVETIKGVLYSQAGEAKARAEGRTLAYDPQTIKLTITDSPGNLARVGQYIESLPELGVKTRQEVVFLKYAVAEDLAPKIELGGIPASEITEETFNLAPGQEHQFAGRVVTLVRIDVKDPPQLQSSRAILCLSANNKTNDFALALGERRVVQNCQFMAEDIKTGASGPSSVRVGVKYPKNPEALKPDARMLEGISVNPFGELNALILRYTNPEAYKMAMDRIAKLDQPNQSVKKQNTATTNTHGIAIPPGAVMPVTYKEVVFKLHPGESKQYRNLGVKLVRLHPPSKPGAGPGGKGSVDILFDTGIEYVDRNNLEPRNTITIADDFNFMVEEITPGSGENDGTATIHIIYLPNRWQNPPGPSATKPAAIEKTSGSDNAAPKLDVENFSLMPVGVKTASDQIRSFTGRVVEAIKSFLYGKEGEAAAAQEGRKLWYDPTTLALTIVDTPDRLMRVRFYLDSLPELERLGVKQAMIALNHQRAEKVTTKIAEISSRIAASNPYEAVFKMRPGEERPFREMRLRVNRIEGDSHKRRNTEAVDLTATFPGKIQNRTLQNVKTRTLDLKTETMGDYRITVEDALAYPEQPSISSVRFRVAYLPELKKRKPGQEQPIPILDRVNIAIISESNCLIVQYHDSKDFQEIKDIVAQLDKPEAGATPTQIGKTTNHTTATQASSVPGTAPKMDIENFSLLPPGEKTASAQMQAMGKRVVGAIKVFLYSQAGETRARGEGRQLWFDPKTLQLTITDKPENLARVRQYIDSLPYLNPKQQQEVIYLRYAVAPDAALTLMNQITLPEKEYAVTMQLNEHSETRIGSPGAGLPRIWNLEFELRSVSPGDMRVPPEQRKDGSANLIVRAGGKPQQQVVAQGTKLSAGGHEITVEEIGCDVTKPERRWVRVRMTFRTQPVEEALPGARRIPGLTIEPVNDLNALIVHYEKQDDLKAVQAMVKDLDVPIKQISVETMFIQPAAGAKRPFDPVADLGATMREFKSSEILRSQDEKAQPAMKPTKLPVIMDLTFEKQEKLRSLGVNGPKVTSLNKREAVFRIDALAPKETPRQVIHDKTTILRVTPEIGKDGKTIRLKNVWLEILDLTKDARGRERVEPTARLFDIEVRNGESVLLTGPEFKGQYVLLTPYLVE